MGRCNLFVFAGIALAVGERLAAQSDAVASQAAADITAAGLARHLGVLAGDSMRGRGPGSAGLESTARYVAEQFKASGLTPMGDSAWVKRYPLVDNLTMDYDESEAWFAGQADVRGRPVVTEQGAVAKSGGKLHWDTDIVLAVDTVVDFFTTAGFLDLFLAGERVTVVAGPQTAASVRQADLRDDVVIYVPPSATDSIARQQVIDQLRRSSNVVIIPDEDSAAFAKRRFAAPPPIVLGWYNRAAQVPRHWVTYVREGAARGALRVAGVDVAGLRAARAPITRAVTMVVQVRVRGMPPLNAVTGLNTVGLLPASDSLARGYIVFTVSMDHAGVSRSQPDGLPKGADATADTNANASAVAGLLSLATAFRRLGGLPRPIVFAAVSGSAAQFQGSAMLAESFGKRALININFDLAGRPSAGDSIRIAGLGDVALQIPADWVAAQHPELGLTVVDDGTIAGAASDHLPFVRRAIPSLFVHTRDPGGAGIGDVSRAIDAEQEARVIRFLFYMGREIANSTASPHWTSEGRRRRIQLLQGAP